MKNITDLKVLLLQLRHDQETLTGEHEAFAEYSGLHRDQIDGVNLFETPSFDPLIVEEYNALFVGGSSDEGDALIVPDKPAFALNTIYAVRHAYDMDIPVFASCFGFQASVVAFGGEVIHDKSRAELGTYDIRITEEGTRDLLFSDTPNPFHAVSVHEKLAAWLPEGAVTLAETDLCHHHAFTFPGKPFYAFQFHPEIDLEEFEQRLGRYRERYVANEEAFQKLLDNAQDVSHANVLLGKFIERVVLTRE
jgi:GMP synthase (glutamine-hydrolysing)